MYIELVTEHHMNADEYTADDVEALLRQVEDEIVRLRMHGDPAEKREGVKKLIHGGFLVEIPTC